MAEGIALGALGKKIRWDADADDWKHILITYHPTISDNPPCFSSSKYLAQDEWISFHMLQSGHRNHVRNYEQIYKDYNRIPIKLVLDGEPNYEEWYYETAIGGAYHGAWNVRKRAYWALFAGACGHAYGHASVWRMLKKNEKDVTLQYSWEEALQSQGAWQMKYLKQFIDRIPFEKTRSAQEMLGITDNYLDIRREAKMAEDGSFAIVYFTSGGEEIIGIFSMQQTKLPLKHQRKD